MTYSVDFAPTRIRRLRFWVPISAILCVGGVAAIALVRPSDSLMNGTAGIASKPDRVIVLQSTSPSRSDSAHAIRGDESVDGPVAIFADRFAFGAAGGIDIRHYVGLPTEQSSSASAHAQGHRHYRHKTNHHKLGLLVHPYRRPYGYLNRSGFERVAGRH